MLSHNDIKKAVIRSQHCQRNWDLSKNIPQEDIELFAYTVSNCPSKQNHSFYKAHFISNRETIEQIHALTNGFDYTEKSGFRRKTTNTQTLANLLVVFEEVETSLTHKAKNKKFEGSSKATAARDRDIAIGLAAGYLNIIASFLGYRTGCCNCYEGRNLKELLNLNGHPMLIMGIGFKNDNKNRRIHHLNDDFMFPTIAKEKISINFID